MKKIFTLAIAIFTVLAVNAQTMDITVINGVSPNPGKQRVIVQGTAVGNFQASDGTDDWLAGFRVTLRMAKSGFHPAIGTGATGSADITSVTNNSFFTASPFVALYTSAEDIVADATGFGQPDDGYVYIMWTTAAANNNVPVPNGTTVDLLSFDFPETWNCPTCVELVDFNPPWASAVFQDIQTFLFNAGTGTNVIGSSVDGPLPIELTSFTARPAGKNVLTQWETATEQNVSHFSIEKSVDLINWIRVGIKEAVGESSTPLQYELIDGSPYSGTSYYRLTAVDNDGEQETFDPVSVNFNEKEPLISLYPNPSPDGAVVVDMINLFNQKSTLTITTVTGQTVFSKQVTPQFASDRFEVPVGTLATGMYEVVLSNESVRLTEKLIVN